MPPDIPPGLAFVPPGRDLKIYSDWVQLSLSCDSNPSYTIAAVAAGGL